MKFQKRSDQEFFLDWNLPYFLCDENLNLTLPGLLRMWTDTSMKHYNSVDVGEEDPSKTWVIYSWDIQFVKMPKAHQHVKTLTFAYEFKKFYAKRNFLLLDAENNVLAYADSVWLLIDLEKSRIGRIDTSNYGNFGDLEPFYEKPRPKIQELDSYSETREVFIRKTDLDGNHHVNNAAVIDLLGEVTVDYSHDFQSLESIIICYQKQIFMGEEVEIQIERQEENLVNARIVSDKETKVTALASFRIREDN